MRELAIAIALVGALACTKSDPVPRHGRASATALDPTTEQIVGRWLMIHEADPDRRRSVHFQGRRLITIRAEGTFEVRNNHRRDVGAWQLDGDALVLGDTRVEIVAVEDERLVLLENVPKDDQDFAKVSRVKNSYRRVSERELGPMLGRELVTSTPTAGSYSAAYDYRVRRFATMEIAIRDRIKGRATLELAADGTASGCFGLATDDQTSEAGYGPGRRWLIGWTGNWRVTDDGKAATKAERLWWGSCADPGTSLGRGLELECQAIAANEALPLPALACRIVGGPQELRMLAINPADTDRAGPYTLQSHMPSGVLDDRGRPWLLFGQPRLVVVSVDESRNPPDVSFGSGAVDLVWDRYTYPRAY